LLLSAAAYWPALRQTFIQDDYPNISLATTWYGAPNEIGLLFNDAICRSRATSYWELWTAWRLFGPHPAGFYAMGILFHAINCLILFALLRDTVFRPFAFLTASIFAIAEGHQEAVMWISAVNELLLFLFGMSAIACWIRCLKTDELQQRFAWPWFSAAIAFYLLACISKESAYVFVPLIVLATVPYLKRRPPGENAVWLKLIPFAIIGLTQMGLVLRTSRTSFRFSDGSFSLSAPVWANWAMSFGALLWFWGAASLLVLILLARNRSTVVTAALIWMGVCLIPYSFLTYSHRIPSRQTYLASAGACLLIAVGLRECLRKLSRTKPALGVSLVALLVISNIGFLWIKKHKQFLARAAPTDQLVSLAKSARSPLWVRCFPYPRGVAEDAVHLMLGPAAPRLAWSAEEARTIHAGEEFCYADVR